MFVACFEGGRRGGSRGGGVVLTLNGGCVCLGWGKGQEAKHVGATHTRTVSGGRACFWGGGDRGGGRGS
jgi:hypothetical protein